MSTIENMQTEQLWYTWSDVGLSSVHAGFRVRAASPGLTDIYGPRVESMDRYMRYALPPGTDRFAITPDMAPVCLAFIRTNNECILVHKNYSGKDGYGRLGNFFVHVIALGEVSPIITPTDAILLWDSHIWATEDRLDRRSNTLPTIPVKELQDEIKQCQPDYVSVQRSLPFLIEAYLTRKGPYPLYIAAPAHSSAMIAYLIAGLVDNLPHQLVAKLTFSTYEPDITKATTEIIGTSWIATPGAEGFQGFTPQFYQQHLAINCATGEHSPLETHPQIESHPLAADFARYVTECLLTGDVQRLYELLEHAEKRDSLDAAFFLRMYYNEIVNEESIVEPDIEKYLADSKTCLDYLCKISFRKRIINRAAENRQWAETRLQSLLLQLLARAEKEYAAASAGRPLMKESSEIPAQHAASLPRGRTRRSGTITTAQPQKNSLTLPEALATLARVAIPRIVDTMAEAMKRFAKRREAVPSQNNADNADWQKKGDTVAALIALMDACLFPQDPYEIWKQLLTQIADTQDAIAFLNTQWGICSWLLKKWNEVFPLSPEYDTAVRPLLRIPWSRLGKFLQLGLRERHKQWNIFAVEHLLQDTSLTPQITQELVQKYSKEINDLLVQLLQEPTPTHAVRFAIRLIEQGYPIQSQFASLMERLVAQLLYDPRDQQLLLYAKVVVVTLTQHEYLGTETYLNLVETLLEHLLSNQQAPLRASGESLVDLLVEHRYPRKKKLVDVLLKYSSIQSNLWQIVQRVYRTREEQSSFFLEYGPGYLSIPDYRPAMRELYGSLLQPVLSAQKLERLFIMLDALLDASLDENGILYFLNITPLDDNERARILERYGKRYLQAFQQSAQLANIVVEWFGLLVKLRYANTAELLVKIFTSQTNYHLLDTLLASAQLSEVNSRQFFKTFGFEQRYFPFFYESNTSLALFSKLAQAANTYVGSGQSELAQEKMNLLLAWLQPSRPLPRQEVVEKILLAASLTSAEQSQFLEKYGVTYFASYPQLPVLRDYISAYIMAFNAESLERKEAITFLRVLAQPNQLQSLDPATQEYIQCWSIIDQYFTSPDASPDRLRFLVQALFKLGLPNNSAVVAKLANAFARCVRSDHDLRFILENMQNVPKLKGNDMIQLLYDVAEQVAELHQQQQNVQQLLPYLSFVLNITNTILRTTEVDLKYFIQQFLDTLLCNIDVLDLNAWRPLDAVVTQQHLSTQAQKRWQDYLNGLHLQDRLSSAGVMENGAMRPETQPQTRSATDVSPEAPSWPVQLLQWIRHPRAKWKLNSALRSNKAERIAEVWHQYDTTSDILPRRQKSRDKVEDAYQLIYLCRVVTERPDGPIENNRDIVELYGKIKALGLSVSKDTQDCVWQADKRLEIWKNGGNPGYLSAGFSQQPGNLPPAHAQNQPDMNAQEFYMQQFKSPTAPGTMSGQPQSGTKFGLYEDRKDKRNKK